MYDVALSVAACVRASTRADVAWMIAPNASTQALALTPGGGRLGLLCGGAFDGMLADVAAHQRPAGRRIRHRVEEWESAASGLAVGSDVEFLVVPAKQFPQELWGALLERQPVIIRAQMDDDDVARIDVVTVDSADEQERGALAASSCTSEFRDAQVTTTLTPGTTLVVAGRGPMAEALAQQGALLGWNVSVESRPEIVAGFAAPLSEGDAIVVMGHDVEASSRCLQAALESNAGYIGALGSHAMQEARADWLAYRDVTDLSRVHGPAGMDIHAATPQEIAVSIAAEIIATLR